MVPLALLVLMLLALLLLLVLVVLLVASIRLNGPTQRFQEEKKPMQRQEATKGQGKARTIVGVLKPNKSLPCLAQLSGHDAFKI